MIANASTATLFTLGASTPVLADATAATVFTRVTYAPVLADASAATLFALDAFTPVLADATTTTLFTYGALTPVRAFITPTFQPTGDTPLAPDTVPIEIELFGGMATFTGPTYKEFSTLCVVSGHSD